MKKSFTLYLIFSFFSIPSFTAQTINLQGGMLRSKMNGTYSGHDNSWMQYQMNQHYKFQYFGYHFGLGADYLKKKYFFLSSNLTVLKSGANGLYNYQPDGFPIIGGTYNTKLMFLSLNTLFNFKIPSKKRYFFYLNLGPRLDYLFDYEDPSYYLYQDLEYYDKNNAISHLQPGLTGGIGMKWILSRIELGAFINHNYNFNPLVYLKESNYDGSSNKHRVYHKYSSFQLSIGYNLKAEN